jgi:hypothetical protein
MSVPVSDLKKRARGAGPFSSISFIQYNASATDLTQHFDGQLDHFLTFDIVNFRALDVLTTDLARVVFHGFLP